MISHLTRYPFIRSKVFLPLFHRECRTGNKIHRRIKALNVYPGYFPERAPDKKILPAFFCPVCGAQLDGGDTLAEDKDGDTVGCVYCIRYYEIWEKTIDE